MMIQLADEDAEIGAVPTTGGGRKPEAQLDKLSNILRSFNDQFGNIPWTDADRIGRLITKELPEAVAADVPYQNALLNSDKQNARIEHDKAAQRAVIARMNDEGEFFKQFMDNDSFRRAVLDAVFGLTYKEGAASA